MSFDFIETELSKVVEISTKKCDSSSINVANYISTENMLPDRQGITISSGIPDVKKINYFEIGDTLFSNIRTYFKKVWFASFNGGASPDVLIFRSTSKQLTNEYLYLILSCDDFIDYTHLTSKGAKMPRGDKGAMMNYKIKLPCLNYQNECTKIIFTLNNKIAINNQINQTLEQMAQALFKSWFVDFEPVKAKIATLENGGTLEEATLAAMSVISGKDEQALVRFKKEQPEKYAELKATAELFPSAMQESELGEIPEGWEVKQFSNIIDQYIDNRGKTPPIVNDGIPIVEVKHLLENLPFPKLNTEKKVNEETFNTWFKAYVDFKDILISTVGTIGRTSFVKNKNFGIAQNVLGLRFGKVVEPEYMFYTIKAFRFQHDMNARLVTTVQSSIKRKDLNTIDILVPLLKLQKVFSKFVGDFLDAQYSNSAENIRLTQLRDSLLPKLLSGEISLSEVEAVNN